MTSPTQRSLQKLRRDGWLCWIVERWNPYAKIRVDMWGYADILAVKGDTALLVQTTSGDNVSKRVRKIWDEPRAKTWLASPSRRIVVHGWRRAGARGKRKLWECREVEITLPTDLPSDI